MLKTGDICFEDESFPIKIIPSRTSVVDDVGDATRALHEAIEIKYFYEGASTLLIGSESVEAKAGDIVIINPYEIHGTVDYGAEQKGRYHLIMVGLDFFGALPAPNVNLRHLVFGKRTVFRNLIRDAGEMKAILEKVIAESQGSDEYSRLAVFGLMSQFFSLLLRCGAESGKGISHEDLTRYYTAVEPAIRLIRDEYGRSFTIDALADVCRISKYHFCRIFKAVTGTSAIRYLINYRLKIADAMLTSTDRSISETASFCGFEDVGYFCKMYKKHFGRTPSKSKER